MTINTDSGVIVETLFHGRYLLRVNLGVLAAVQAEKARLRVREDIRNYARLREVNQLELTQVFDPFESFGGEGVCC